jgi:hypothetical protein
MKVRELAEKLKSGHLMLEDVEGNEISSGTIEDEDLLDLEVVSIELVDDIYLLVKVEA